MLLTIIGTVGWLTAFGAIGILRLLSQVYLNEKLQNEVLRKELKELKPTDWNQWVNPNA